MLCSGDDLKEMGLPFGPRKKVLEGINTRKAQLESESTSF